jgi:hypothetical protein
VSFIAVAEGRGGCEDAAAKFRQGFESAILEGIRNHANRGGTQKHHQVRYKQMSAC